VEPWTATESIRLRRIDHLIHYVPCVHVIPEMTHYATDVILQPLKQERFISSSRGHRIAADVVEDPGRNLLVPHQSVSAHPHVVGFGIRDLGIGIGEAE